MSSSVRSRLLFSILVNLLRSIISFATGMFVARGLGPEQYGAMAFLLGTFMAVRQLLDMGSSTAFFTFISQRHRSNNFIRLYFFWLGVQFFIPLLAVGLIFPDEWVKLVWKGEQRYLVTLAFVAAYVQSTLWTAVVRMGESKRLTCRVQGIGLLIVLVHLLLMIIAWWSDWLQINTVLFLIIVEWGVASAIVAKWVCDLARPSEEERPKAIIMEFWNYCAPLIPYAWLSFAYEFADRWLIQNYGGNVQQAYYSVAIQVSAIASILTSSILNILWKEVAEAHHQNNLERVILIYKSATRSLFFVAAAIAGFLVPWSEEILAVFLGKAYVGGAMTLMLMLSYPIHQSMGQVCGTMAYATGQISGHVIIGLIFTSLSILAAYFILASPDEFIPGLNMGSVGLAAKMVIFQILQVNAIALYLSRRLNFNFDWLFQPTVVTACFAVGLFAYYISHAVMNAEIQVVGTFLFSGTLYFIIILGLIGIAPSLAGIRRVDLNPWISSVLRLIRK